MPLLNFFFLLFSHSISFPPSHSLTRIQQTTTTMRKERKKKILKEGKEKIRDWIFFFYMKRNIIETYFTRADEIKMGFSWSIDENKDGKCMQCNRGASISYPIYRIFFSLLDFECEREESEKNCRGGNLINI